MVIVPELIAVWLALSLYTAAFIAEIVRAGILAVAKGQTEASYSLGLRPGMTLRLIIIPQALRVIIPATDLTVFEFNQKLISWRSRSPILS